METKTNRSERQMAILSNYLMLPSPKNKQRALCNLAMLDWIRSGKTMPSGKSIEAIKGFGQHKAKLINIKPEDDIILSEISGGGCFEKFIMSADEVDCKGKVHPHKVYFNMFGEIVCPREDEDGIVRECVMDRVSDERVSYIRFIGLYAHLKNAHMSPDPDLASFYKGWQVCICNVTFDDMQFYIGDLVYAGYDGNLIIIDRDDKNKTSPIHYPCDGIWDTHGQTNIISHIHSSFKPLYPNGNGWFSVEDYNEYILPRPTQAVINMGQDVNYQIMYAVGPDLVPFRLGDKRVDDFLFETDPLACRQFDKMNDFIGQLHTITKAYYDLCKKYQENKETDSEAKYELTDDCVRLIRSMWNTGHAWLGEDPEPYTGDEMDEDVIEAARDKFEIFTDQLGLIWDVIHEADCKDVDDTNGLLDVCRSVFSAMKKAANVWLDGQADLDDEYLDDLDGYEAGQPDDNWLELEDD